MQNFQTTAGKPYSFADDVIVTETGGAYSFKTAAGVPLNVPTDLTPCPNNQLPGPTAAQQWAEYQAKALEILKQSDVTLARITEAVIAGKTTFTAPDVTPWATFRAKLRAIGGAPTGDPAQPLPAQPAYPAGT